MTIQEIENMLQNIPCRNDPDYNFLVYIIDITKKRKALYVGDYLRLETLAKRQGKLYNINRYQEADIQVHLSQELENKYIGDRQEI
jgi:hypothetical protein